MWPTFIWKQRGEKDESTGEEIHLLATFLKVPTSEWRSLATLLPSVSLQAAAMFDTNLVLSGVERRHLEPLSESRAESSVA